MFHTELRYPPTMNDISRSNQKTNFFMNGNDKRTIHFTEIKFTFWFIAMHLIVRRGEIAKESKIFFQVIVTPFPLVSCYFDGEVGLCSIMHVNENASCWDG